VYGLEWCEEIPLITCLWELHTPKNSLLLYNTYKNINFYRSFSMKLFLTGLAVFLCLVSSIALAQPKIELKSGTNLSFGDVVSGAKVSKEVTIMNTGKDTLHIKDVRAQCGCTATLLREKVLAPAQEANLSITFNATGYRAGKVQKHVYIESDDPQTPTLTLEFEPNVIQILDITPNMLSFNDAKVDSEMTRSVKIKNTSHEPIKIVNIDNTFEYLKVSTSKNELAPGDSLELTGVLKTPKPGSYQATVILMTDNPNLSRAEVKVFMWVNRKLDGNGK